MVTITKINALEILDSRGNPTIQVMVETSDGNCAQASVPSGASTGSKEALELRDNDKNRYLGKGVQKAIANIHQKIAPILLGKDLTDLALLDQIMMDLDGDLFKQNLGANSILGVSLAIAKAKSLAEKKPLFQVIGKHDEYVLPVPMMNIINGGSHADNSVDIQEFMIMPAGFDSFKEAIRAGVEIFHALKSILKQNGLNTAVGDEGGFAPDLPSNESAFEIIMQSIDKAGYRAGEQIFLAMDAAASEFYQDGKYVLTSEGKSYNSLEFIDYLNNLVNSYPLISIEDGLDESDWDGWSLLTQKLGDKIQLVGDDLFVTNAKILQEGIDKKIANAILIKPNQIGSLKETLLAIDLAEKAGYASVISHRSGETEDSFIADIAVATSATQIKTGSLCRSDRIAKYNRLLTIEDLLGKKARYAGKSALLVKIN